MAEKRVKQLVSLEDFVEIVVRRAFKKEFIEVGVDINGDKYPDALAGHAYMTGNHKIAVSDETWCKKFFDNTIVECKKELLLASPRVAFYDNKKETYICYRYGENDIDDKIHDVIVKLNVRNAWTFVDISPVAFELENGFWITVAPTYVVDDDVDIEHTPIPELKKLMHVPTKIVGIDKFKEALKSVAGDKNKYDAVLKALSRPKGSMF